MTHLELIVEQFTFFFPFYKFFGHELFKYSVILIVNPVFPFIVHHHERKKNW